MGKGDMLRIISMPLRRPPPSITPITLRPRPHIMTYYQFQLNPPRPQESSAGRPRWMPEGGLLLWAQNKAADTWAGFGKAKEGSWKLKVFQYGERVVDRIDFEELALKGVDPSIGPTVLHPDFSGKVGRKESSLVKQTVQIPLLYPPSIISGEASLAHLLDLLEHREPRHRKGFWIWMIAAPFTAPFMIIPVIPNLPFFFCVWRSWSHYRAYRASQYLKALLGDGTIVPQSSKILDQIYHDYLPKALPSPPNAGSSDPKKSPKSPIPEEQLLLSREAIPKIISSFNLRSSAAADMYRAVEQARVRVKT
ncbi:hypothetical protein ARMGADRAFT_987831 [Armillaria gallica]|uniref:Mitochondrial K+-H+ exchange-related-domain-containing protein n=1 Tax=Armillaria gallica TaxID=47427 RepID=A0A2H3DRJ4_ARMGA|nr:hypothetical protein ARMGADRAFT_987831 [Armillaria gallica]